MSKEFKIDAAKAAETRAAKKAEKDAAGLTLGWTRKQAIFAKCFECMNDSLAEVRNCGNIGCPLWPFRSRVKPTAKELKHWEGQFVNDPVNAAFVRRMQMGDEETEGGGE